MSQVKIAVNKNTYGAHVSNEQELQALFSHLRRYYEIAKSLNEELEVEVELVQPTELPEA